jgi:hypothetical protein
MDLATASYPLAPSAVADGRMQKAEFVVDASNHFANCAYWREDLRRESSPTAAMMITPLAIA